jgi:hypothetical protein
MSAIVKCLDDLKQAVQSIARVKVARITSSPEELASLIKQASSNLEVGVVYQGLASVSDGEGYTPKGLAGKAQFGLYFAFQSPESVPESESRKFEIIETMDSMRLQLLGVSSPTGHKWEFVSESFADTIGKRSIWVQQWRTTVVK